MKRMIVFLAAVALALGLAAPAVLAAQPTFDHTGTVLMAFNGDVTVPAGDVADAVFVTGGTATIHGTVESVVVIDGTAVLEGAAVQSVVVTGGSVSVDAASTVSGDVRTLGATATIDPAATIGGTVSSLETDLIAAGAVLAPAIVLFMLGLALVTIVAGLALAALAAQPGPLGRGPDAATEPIQTFARRPRRPGRSSRSSRSSRWSPSIGAPLGLAIMFVVWPAAAFAGYLVAGIWIGEWLLGRMSARRATGSTIHGRRRRSARPPDHQHRAVRRGDRQPVRVRGRPAPRLADVPPAVSGPAGHLAAGDSADGCLNLEPPS